MEHRQRRRACPRRIRTVFSRALASVLGIVLFAGAASFSQAAPERFGPDTVELRSDTDLTVEYPGYLSVVPEPRGCGSYVAGFAGLTRFDLIFVIDVSDSTRDPSGADIDQDGLVGRARLDVWGRFENTDPGDSILAAEIAAAREVLHGLQPIHTRVGVVAFSGTQRRPLEWLVPRTPSAETLQHLTLDHAAVDAALDRMASHVPKGGTHMAAAIDRALADYAAAEAFESPKLERQRLMLFFTDGYPTLPFGPEEEAANIEAVIEATARAQEADARIHTFAIGNRALASPMAVVEMAARSGGTFTPVRDPSDLVDAVRQAMPGQPRVSLRNATTGDTAFPFSVGPDGAFQGLVQLARGRNRLEVRAAWEDAPVQFVSLEVDADPDAPPPDLPAHLVARRIALLEKCLAALKQLTLEAERQRAERLRERLAREIERERRRAKARAEAQRKRLEIRAEADEQP